MLNELADYVSILADCASMLDICLLLRDEWLATQHTKFATSRRSSGSFKPHDVDSSLKLENLSIMRVSYSLIDLSRNGLCC